MNNDWLEELRALREADRSRRDAELAQANQSDLHEKSRREQADKLMRDIRAHDLLRQVQKVLLDGQGTLSVYESPKRYDRAIVLAWAGSVSAAQRPDPKGSEDYAYILVGVRDNTLLVNEKAVTPPTAEALKAALVQAGKNPAIHKRDKNDA